ncbi:MAG TPA: hypothetical protein VMR76_00955 [Candidatus Saccharimonadia bacterium]|nr:hypothetical protein [Candidatus Saccharimonadia bacterium]
MRHRLEDLGRLAVLIRNLLDNQLFDENFLPRRPKDYWEWFNELSDDKKDEVLRSWVYGIDNLKDKLYDMLGIAEGTGPLNEKENEQE